MERGGGGERKERGGRRVFQSAVILALDVGSGGDLIACGAGSLLWVVSARKCS